VPLVFADPTHGPVSVDWIYGAAMMWRTLIAREVGFCEAFAGYAQGEDLEFSLRAGKLGALLLLPAARALHIPDPSGRPDFFKLGYMGIRNRYHIHRNCLDDRGWRDIAWFIYAWSVDSVLLTRLLLRKGMTLPVLKQLAGRAKAAIDIVAKH
jgi:GT2 family glycosyltransferase